MIIKNVLPIYENNISRFGLPPVRVIFDQIVVQYFHNSIRVENTNRNSEKNIFTYMCVCIYIVFTVKRGTHLHTLYAKVFYRNISILNFSMST